MKYLDQKSIQKLGANWEQLTKTAEDAVVCLSEGQTVQPIKPYLRFKNLTNRIISMPAYLGNNFDIAGIKWIASFPDNIHKGIPRANSVTILNSADTGEPISIINTSLVSVIRTVAVSRLLLKRYNNHKKLVNPKIGITGFGPIGQYHLQMVQDFFKDTNAEIFIYDLKPIHPELLKDASNVTVTDSWEKAFEGADVFITCTVSDKRYINAVPKENSLHLNVSLRDYSPEMLKYFKKGIVVDKWEEICRENTDIEAMHKECGLQKEDTYSIIDVVVNDCLEKLVNKTSVMFNPMGMSIFDMAVAKVFYTNSVAQKVGVDL
ncbi:2,3-diaminopropionate biosynthesis protein SbnB [Ascidiimonas sp. W6]|uniref:2,3-diaminopropionate biosynthesis protein SbnB n=1 Tax=Ascidiimonas meishanensis TaxID=3128903 RepID=UPI0030EDCD94